MTQERHALRIAQKILAEGGRIEYGNMNKILNIRIRQHDILLVGKSGLTREEISELITIKEENLKNGFE